MSEIEEACRRLEAAVRELMDVCNTLTAFAHDVDAGLNPPSAASSEEPR